MFASVLAPPPASVPAPRISRADRQASHGAAWTSGTDSLWYVTVPVTLPDGRPGTQTFVERADTCDQAREAALCKADTPDALRRRRNALILPTDQVRTEPWQRPGWW
ncbi:hypothetical protein [Kitasatospora sp. NPDC088346]|uniref:hypothetical protein n=1 Tax=Kitasatospora sp. NPDC088346 TaxID=3364073 RepID=UPI00381FE45B